MELIKELETKLKKEWQVANNALTCSEHVKLRAKALETYRLIRKQKQLIGCVK